MPTCIHVVAGARKSTLYMYIDDIIHSAQDILKSAWELCALQEAKEPIVCGDRHNMMYSVNHTNSIILTKRASLPFPVPHANTLLTCTNHPCLIFWPRGDDMHAVFPHKPSVCWPSMCAFARPAAKITQSPYPPFS